MSGLDAWADDVSTAFNYQGELIDDGAPVDGECDFQFTLWNDPASTIPYDRVGPILSFVKAINAVQVRLTLHLHSNLPNLP